MQRGRRAQGVRRRAAVLRLRAEARSLARGHRQAVRAGRRDADDLPGHMFPGRLLLHRHVRGREGPAQVKHRSHKY